MMNEVGSPLNISSTGAVKNGTGKLMGVFCASSTSGTLKLWDNTAGSGTVIVNTFNLTAATFYEIPASFANGLYATVGGTADITLFVS